MTVKLKVKSPVDSKWEICSDGYYPYCKACNYEPSWEMAMAGLPAVCPQCGAYMTNHEKFTARKV